MNVCVQASTWTYVCISLGQIPRSKMSGSYSRYMFNFLSNQDRTFLLNPATKQYIHIYMLKV